MTATTLPRHPTSRGGDRHAKESDSSRFVGDCGRKRPRTSGYFEEGHQSELDHGRGPTRLSQPPPDHRRQYSHNDDPKQERNFNDKNMCNPRFVNTNAAAPHPLARDSFRRSHSRSRDPPSPPMRGSGNRYQGPGRDRYDPTRNHGNCHWEVDRWSEPLRRDDYCRGPWGDPKRRDHNHLPHPTKRRGYPDAASPRDPYRPQPQEMDGPGHIHSEDFRGMPPRREDWGSASPPFAEDGQSRKYDDYPQPRQNGYQQRITYRDDRPGHGARMFFPRDSAPPRCNGFRRKETPLRDDSRQRHPYTLEGNNRNRQGQWEMSFSKPDYYSMDTCRFRSVSGEREMDQFAENTRLLRVDSAHRPYSSSSSVASRASECASPPRKRWRPLPPSAQQTSPPADSRNPSLPPSPSNSPPSGTREQAKTHHHQSTKSKANSVSRASSSAIVPRAASPSESNCSKATSSSSTTPTVKNTAEPKIPEPPTQQQKASGTSSYHVVPVLEPLHMSNTTAAVKNTRGSKVLEPPTQPEKAKETTLAHVPPVLDPMNKATAPLKLQENGLNQMASKPTTHTADAPTRLVTTMEIRNKGTSPVNPTSIDTDTLTSVAKKPAVAPPTKDKKKTSTGIPMRWLKPAPKPKLKTAPAPVKPANDHICEKTNVSGTAEKPAVNKERGVPGKSRAKSVSAPPLSPLLNRTVTDSEGGSTVSNARDLLQMVGKKQSAVPSAIVTKPNTTSVFHMGSPESLGEELSAISKRGPLNKKISTAKLLEEEDSDSEPPLESDSTSDDDNDSATDEEEVMMWASKMFGVPPPSQTSQDVDASKNEMFRDAPNQEKSSESRKPLKLRLKLSPSKILAAHHHAETTEMEEAERRRRRKEKKRRRMEKRRVEYHVETTEVSEATRQGIIKLKQRGRAKKNQISYLNDMPEEAFEKVDPEQEEKERKEEKRIREEAKPLTAAQIRAILGDDGADMACSSNWVRRSVRQPSRALLNSKSLKALISGLKDNDPDMVVLKMKKYINDPNTPACVIDEALEAMEENTNCEALYIQNFNEGMRDRQVLHLLRILQSPKCNIWCLNIGENYNVETETWEKFTKGLRRTKITHMYASEHTITTEMKDEIRETIRENRKKHDRHINSNNLDVIIQCTHCWWNPINAKTLRPYLKKKGYEYILHDKEAQGLRGSMSAAPST